MSMHQYLSDWKTEHHHASTSAQAFFSLLEAAASDHPFEVAIIEKDMPNMNGLMLARAIKSDSNIAMVQLVMLNSS